MYPLNKTVMIILVEAFALNNEKNINLSLFLNLRKITFPLFTGLHGSFWE